MVNSPAQHFFYMKSLLFTAFISLFWLSAVFAQAPPKAGSWQSLFNGKDFSGWETYLDRPYDSGCQKCPTAGSE